MLANESDLMLNVPNLCNTTAASVSSSTSDEQQSITKRGKSKVYFFIKTYKTLEEAQEVIKDEKMWRYKSTSVPDKKTGSKKIYYQCNKPLTKGN